ncbi:MAG: hypothetical protein WD795_00845 [Woeseia sp.]
MTASAVNNFDTEAMSYFELSDSERECLLDETCDRDTNLRSAVERMLQDCESDDGPLLQPGGGA